MGIIKPTTRLRARPSTVQGQFQRLVSGSGVLAATISTILGTGLVTTPSAENYETTHYVAPFASVSGATSDSDTVNGTPFASATSPETPCTIQEALDNGVGGNHVQVAYGVYLLPSSEDDQVITYRPANNGTAGNELVFFAENPATETANTALRSKFTHDGDLATSTGSPCIGGGSNSYIIWDGFWIDEADANPKADTTGVILFNSSNHCQARRIVGAGTDVTGYDTWAEATQENHNAIRFEDSNTCRVVDSEFSGFYNPAQNNNGAAVMFYALNADAHSNIVEYCRFTDCASGYFLKGKNPGRSMSGNICRFCIFDGIYDQTMQAGDGDGTYGNNLFYCNLLMDGDRAFMLGRYDNPFCDVFNNTVVRFNQGLYIKASAAVAASTYRNNIHYEVGTHLYIETSGDETEYRPDFNCYYNSTGDEWRYNAEGGGTTYTDFATYVAAQAASWEANSINTNPLMTDPDNDDFTLGGSSPCIGQGDDYLSTFGGGTIDMGAFPVPGITHGVRFSPNYSS